MNQHPDDEEPKPYDDQPLVDHQWNSDEKIDEDVSKPDRDAEEEE